MGDEALTTDYLRVFASPKLDWSHGKIELTMKVPVNLYSYFFSGAMQNRTEFFVSPSLSVRWRITPRMTLSLRGSARRSPASLHNIHDSSILTDYRSFSAGVDDYYTASGQSVSVSYSLRNTQTGIFIIAMGGLGWNKSKFGTVQEISGDYIFHSYRSKPSESRTASAMLNVTKSLDFMRGAVGMRGNYARNENSLLSQGVNTRYQNDSFSLSPFMNGNISSYFNWNLGFTWDRSLLSISDMSTRHTDNYIYKGSLTLTPCDLVTWTVGGEIYRNQIEEGRHKNMTMLDTKLSFNITKRLEISASVTNLLNRKTYSYTTYSTVSQLERSSLLRGREFMLSIYLKK
ncbi:MAG: TonB-dependent receptor [Bacteroides sp.]|nr:TonB-dependent receptor [Bacteroides sp.]